MDELLRQLLSYAHGAWAYRWWGLVVTWVIGIAGATVVYLLPDKYEASARIYVDTQSVLAPLMAGLAVPSDVNQQVLMLSKTLISRPNVEKLIRKADLDLDAKAGKEGLIDNVTNRIRIQSVGRDNLYTLSYLDQNPARAKRVAQELVSIFVESGLKDRRQGTDSARRFLDDQISDYEKRLDDAESRLKEFKLKNMSVLGEEGKDSFSRMGDITTKLQQARLDLREAENSRDATKRQLAGEDTVFLPDSPAASSSGISIPEIDGRIDTLKKQLDELLRSYTASHPDVIGIRRRISQLEQEKTEEIKARRAAGVTTMATNTNPVYQQLKISLAESEASIATLRTRVAEYETRAAEASKFMKLGPQIEQEFTQLNRDYDLNKKNYEELLVRRDKLSISDKIDSTQGMAQFNLVDPPSVPAKPSAPNRKLLFVVAVIGALLGGVAFSLLISQLRPAFYESRSLRETTGLPILGSVTLIRSTEQTKKDGRRQLAFSGALISFVMVYGAMAVFTLLKR